MSNRETAEFLAENINEGLKYIWLCHLSKDNNHPELAYKTVELLLRSKGVLVGKDVQLIALKRSTPSMLYECICKSFFIVHPQGFEPWTH